jgi:hypothetical protein
MGREAVNAKTKAADFAKLAVTRANECIAQVQTVTTAQTAAELEVSRLQLLVTAQRTTLTMTERRLARTEQAAELWRTLTFWQRLGWLLFGVMPAWKAAG